MRELLLNQRNLTQRFNLLSVLFIMLLMPLSAWGQWDTKTFTFNGATDDILYANVNDETIGYSWFYRSSNGYYCAGLEGSNVKISVGNNYGKCILTPPDNFTIKKVTLNYSNLEVTEGSKIYVRAVNRTDTTTHYTDPYLMTSGGTLDINLNNEGILSDNLCFLIFSNDDKAYSYILNSITITKIADYHLSIGDFSLTGSNVNTETGAVTGMDGFYFTPAVGSTPATLTLESVNYGPTLTGIVWSGSGDLKIQYSGNNTINTRNGSELNPGDDGYCIIAKNTSGLIFSATNDASTLTLRPSNGGTPDSNNSRAAISGFSNVTFDSGWGMYYTDDNSAATATNLTKGAEVIISKGAPLDITIAGVIVTSGNALNITGDDITGTVSYDAENKILTLNSATIIPEREEYGIEYTGTAGLTISLKGTDNVVKGGGGCPAIGYYNEQSQTIPSLTFTKGDTQACSVLLEAKGETVIDVFTNISYDGLYRFNNSSGEGATLISTTNFTSVFPYDLWIGDTQVTSDNATNVLGDGKVSFTVSGDQVPTYTLTLNGVTLTQPIKVGIDNLTIDIQGTNSITTEERCIQKMDNTTPAVTFTSTSAEVSNLTLKGTEGVNSVGEYGDGSFTISDKLALVLKKDGYTYSNQYWFTDGSTKEAILSTSYGVTVGDMQICADNAADVIGEGIGDGDERGSGMVSFNKETNTLTLNNASLSGVIRSSLRNLTIDLVGNNSIYSDDSRALQAGSAVYMTITSSALAKGSFSMRNSISNFVDDNVNLTIAPPLSVIYGNLSGNTGADNSATIGVSYGITITNAAGSYPITSVNRKNVLNDSQGEETVQFDGIKTLMLNGATLQSINIANQHELKELVIYLKGNNTINNNDNNGIIYGGDPNLPLTYATGDGSTTALQPGTLECSYYVQVAEHPEVMNIYDNFSSVTYNNNLSENQNTTDHKIKVDVALTPIITKEQPEVTNEGDAGKGIGEDIQQYIAAHPELNTTEKVTAAFKDGVTIKNILYILASDDGRDETDITTNVLNLNTKMDDATASVLASDLKDSGVSPSSDYFTSNFKGLCFLLPAGSGEIKLNLRTNEYGEVHVMIGSGAAIPISTEIYQDYTIGYSVTEDTYVLIYSVADPKSSSRPFAAPRAPGRKMTTTTQIKSVGVRASRVSSAPEPPLSPKSLSKSDITLSNGSYVSIKNVKIDDAEAGNVAEMDDDVFEDIKTNDTPLTYVDLSQTALTGLTVDRTNLPWKNLPATTFIYLPVGNKAKADEKNVIIGSVSDDVEFMETGAFETPMDFTATKATLKRDFSEKIGKKCSIFLPFALDEETAAELGTFYQMAPVSAQIEGKIVMETVEKTVANVPYMFKPAKEAISVNMVEVLKTIPAPTAVKDVFFEGTFEEKTVMSDSDFDVYCFMGDQFVRVKDDPVTLSPFRSYMYKVASSSLSNELDIDWGDGTTSIKNMKVGIEDNIYYDLQGRRVLYPQKGIYIVNGKKVILK